MIPATLIAVEGADRCGKATQSTLLVKRLNEMGWKAARVEVPVKSPITYRLIYWMLRNGHAKRYPNVFQFIQFLNKWMFQVFKLAFMRWTVDFVVFDRWKLSAFIYGNATGTNPRLVDVMYDALRDPDLTFILMGSALGGSVTDDYEADDSLQSRVRKAYADHAESHVGKIVVVQNGGSREQISDTLVRSLEEREMV